MVNAFEEFEAEYKAYKDFTSLNCWKDCRSVKLYFYREVLAKLPASEKYSMELQIRKSARSITANIAEGIGRYSYQETIQFVRISRGSLYELKDDLISCFDHGFVSEFIYREGMKRIEKAKASLSGFIRYLNNKKSTQTNNHAQSAK